MSGTPAFDQISGNDGVGGGKRKRGEEPGAERTSPWKSQATPAKRGRLVVAKSRIEIVCAK